MGDYSSELFSKRGSDFAEGEKFQKLVNEAEKEKNTFMERLNDSLREIENLKETNRLSLVKIEDLMSEILKTSEHKRLFELKEQEYAEMKKSKDSQIKSLKQDNEKVIEKLENAKDKVMQMSLVYSENEKLKSKLKELSNLKDKNSENTTLLTTIESKERIIDALSKENSSLLCKLEKCEEDLSAEKKKNLALGKDHENLIKNFYALNEDFVRIKKFLDRKSIKIEDEQGIVLDELYSNEANNNYDNNNPNNNRKSVAAEARNSQFKKRPIGIRAEGNALIAEIESEDENNYGRLRERNVGLSVKKVRENRCMLEKGGNVVKNERFSFEESEDEEKNQGIALNSVIGDRVSVMKDNFLRFKRDENLTNNFMSIGSFNNLNRRSKI
jgi:hypothetical protein